MLANGLEGLRIAVVRENKTKLEISLLAGSGMINGGALNTKTICLGS